MDNARRIVHIDDAKPRSNLKKKKTIVLGLVAGLVGFGIVLWVLSFWGNKDPLTIEGYTLAEVTLGPFEKTTEASGSVILPITASVLSPQEGYLDTVYVEEGELVQRGSTILSLEVPDLLDSKEDLSNTLVNNRLSLKDAEFDLQYTTTTYQSSIERLEASLEKARGELLIQKELANLRSARQSDVDTAEDAVDAAQEKLDDARVSRDRDLFKGELAVEKARMALNQTLTALERVQEDIEAARVRSPISGEVLSLSTALEVPGTLLARNTNLATIADRSETYIDFEVNEEYAGLLSLGGLLEASVGTTTYKATITKIGKVASTSSDGLTSTISVRTKPENATNLTPGASAVAIISLGVQNDVLTLPRGTYLSSGGQRWVYKVQGNTAIKTEVKLGSIQGNAVEIISGLEAGDQIISSSYQSFIDQGLVVLGTK